MISHIQFEVFCLISLFDFCDDVDTNECEVNNGNCSPLATCYDTPWSFTCTCPPGFTAEVFENTLLCTGKWNQSLSVK